MGRGLPTLPLACTQWSSDVGYGLQQSPEDFTHRSTNIERFLTTLSIYCKHRYADVDCGILGSSVAYEDLFADVGCGLQASTLPAHMILLILDNER